MESPRRLVAGAIRDSPHHCAVTAERRQRGRAIDLAGRRHRRVGVVSALFFMEAPWTTSGGRGRTGGQAWLGAAVLFPIMLVLSSGVVGTAVQLLLFARLGRRHAAGQPRRGGWALVVDIHSRTASAVQPTIPPTSGPVRQRAVRQARCDVARGADIAGCAGRHEMGHGIRHVSATSSVVSPAWARRPSPAVSGNDSLGWGPGRAIDDPAGPPVLMDCVPGTAVIFPRCC